MTDDRLRTTSSQHAGFTLVEIMVVVVILGLLATLVATNAIRSADDARLAKAASDVRTILDVARQFRMQNTRTPTLDDLTRPDPRGHALLEELSKDPWGNDYVIRDLDNGRFEVASLGPDRVAGTEDDIVSPVRNG